MTNEQTTLCGVPGRFTHRTTYHTQAENIWFKQRFISESRPCPKYGKNAQIIAELRFDDECKNGHNTFAITGEIFEIVRGRKNEIAGGCVHDEITAAFPEFAHLIKWHLTSTDGPMHYLANSVYLASDADSSGKRKGEPKQWEHGYIFGDSPIAWRVKASLFQWIEAKREFNASTPKTNPAHGFRIVSIEHANSDSTGYKFSPKYTFEGFANKWHECPFDDESQAQQVCQALNTCTVTAVRDAVAYSEGKARELDAARRAAVWADATDEELCAPSAELRAKLEARLPALLASFRADIEAAGFMWEPTPEIAAQFGGRTA